VSDRLNILSRTRVISSGLLWRRAGKIPSVPGDLNGAKQHIAPFTLLKVTILTVTIKIKQITVSTTLDLNFV